MTVVFEKEVLISALVPALGAVSTRNTVPAIEGILMDCRNEGKCILSAYDMDKGMRTVINAEIEEYGACIIHAQKLLQIVRVMPGDRVRITVDDSLKAMIESGRSSFELKALAASDFPLMPELGGEYGFRVPQHLFRDFVSRVSFAISQNDQRPAFCGAFFRVLPNKLTVVSCDTNRLAICEEAILLENTNRDASDLDLEFIVPGKTLNEVLRLVKDTEDDMEIRLTRKHVIFRVGEIVFFSKQIEAEYVDYTRIIPKGYPIALYLNAADLRGALERCALITEDRLAGSIRSYVKLTLEDQILRVTTVSSTGSVLDEIPVESVNGGSLVIGFNCKFLLEALKSCDDGEVLIRMSTPLMGISIEKSDRRETEPGKDDNSKFMFFVMPLKMNN